MLVCNRERKFSYRKIRITEPIRSQRYPTFFESTIFFSALCPGRRQTCTLIPANVIPHCSRWLLIWLMLVPLAWKVAWMSTESTAHECASLSGANGAPPVFWHCLWAMLETNQILSNPTLETHGRHQSSVVTTEENKPKDSLWTRTKCTVWNRLAEPVRIPAGVACALTPSCVQLSRKEVGNFFTDHFLLEVPRWVSVCQSEGKGKNKGFPSVFDKQGEQ